MAETKSGQGPSSCHKAVCGPDRADKTFITGHGKRGKRDTGPSSKANNGKIVAIGLPMERVMALIHMIPMNDDSQDSR